ncbi:class I SAM-dependent methyltransferase [Methylobacterium trifolii]|uniref:Ubiquinone biosynthesis O-methyltransferase, mitochondrial n=1 Tax=Methylobacterium trifolii TaxID=1003092 RepID=A0ABQ4U2U4_9HYPH|nr:class I SAM-dependent methyltransferase [Methylobacterium trifolii]GJE61586.1 Ubiquinone biosynthesis O-methyltransferase, mitochondrial [Methylobacterium trifolii]
MTTPDRPGDASARTRPAEPEAPGLGLAILFWFYKAPEICEDRLRQLRALNPGTAIYGLYGGPPGEAAGMGERLGPLLDDLYLFAQARDDAWKWRHGDQLVAAWHRDRGRHLPWDTVVLVQWDMLLLKPVAELFAMLRPGEALFSGFRPAEEVAGWWGWLDPARPGRAGDLDAFRHYLLGSHGYDGPLWCCLFVVVCLPRGFLDRYLAAGHPEAGFLEYKLPTLAKVFGTPVCTDHPFVPWWAADPATRDAPAGRRLLNAVGDDVPAEVVRAESAAGRAHVFHPFRRVFAAGPSPVPACRLCGNAAGNRCHAAREMMLGRRDPFDYVECAACGCLQIETVPANLGEYYGADYYSFGDLDGEFADPARRRQYAEAVRGLLTLPEAEAAAIAHADMRRPLWSLRRLDLERRRRILDVGCGSGRLLYQLRLAGWTDGVGIDPYLAGDLRYDIGLDVRRASLAEVEGSFDAIMMHHVFEHLPDPADALRQVAARLAPGGLCLLRLPLADSQAWETYGTDWVQLDAPRHLFLHTRRSLERLIAAAGLRIVDVVHDSYDLQFWGSEQYRRDIPLFDPRSYRWGQGAPLFTAEAIAGWRAEAERLNRAGRGDQAAFYLAAA